MSLLKKLIIINGFCLLSVVFSIGALADDPVAEKKPAPTIEAPQLIPSKVEALAEDKERADELRKQQSALESLEKTQVALNEKIKEQGDLQRSLKAADQSAKAEIQLSLDKVNSEIKSLSQSFEQVAIGGVSLEVFGEEEAFDWKKELVLITQPVLESLKGLTEKPRKIERLRSIISERDTQVAEIERAIETVQTRLASQPPTTIAAGLKETLSLWQGYEKNNLREIELAKVQLDSLLGSNVPWYESLSITFNRFFEGRGRTIFIAFMVSLVVWLLMKVILWLLLYRKASETKKPNSEPRKLTSYRVALYLYKALTTLLIVLAVMIVLYVRGDLLLLALMIIIFIGMAIALKTLLPRYITEARLLLNLSTVREGERIIYNGIPWEVTHINVHSILKNPCLQGVLRVPLSELTSLNSRPFNNDETWFPSKKGEYLLMPDGTVAEVLSQSPESVELETRGGMRITHPTQNLFGMDLYNLSRGGSFGIASVFGIDYAHAAISLSTVPEVFKQATIDGLRSAGLNEHVEDVLVDFQTANSSSLDYLIYVTMNSRVASSYFKVSRVIQQSCVRACNDNSWGIPFPQLTVHKPNS